MVTGLFLRHDDESFAMEFQGLHSFICIPSAKCFHGRGLAILDGEVVYTRLFSDFIEHIGDSSIIVELHNTRAGWASEPGSHIIVVIPMVILYVASEWEKDRGHNSRATTQSVVVGVVYVCR